ncbi:MAG: ABC transporter ATP-binding protein [Dehalococcoidia bacterium]
MSILGLQIDRLTARAGSFQLREATLAVGAGRTLALLGPSGAGKTLLLEAIAGFRAARGGTIRLDGVDMGHLPPEQRRIGLVFQDYALFPHLSVAENVRFGLRARGLRDVAAADAALGHLGIARLARRRPTTLSGGERQRVAVARALATSPRLVLLDEPLSAIDAPTRDELRDVLRRVLKELAVPAIYVTHDQAEALAIGDDLAVIMDGVIRQIGAASEVFTRPADADVARFIGMEVLDDASCDAAGDVRVRGHRLRAETPAPLSGRVSLCYRPEDVELSLPLGPCPEDNAFDLRVGIVTPAGPCERVVLDGVLPLTSLVMRRTRVELALHEGMTVRATLPAAAIHLVADGP